MTSLSPTWAFNSPLADSIDLLQMPFLDVFTLESLNHTGSSLPTYYKSPSTISSQPANPQHNFEPPNTPTALPQIQNSDLRFNYKNPKRKLVIPNMIQVQKAAKCKCTFPDCTRRFTQISHLKRHKKIHTEDKSHTCIFCKRNLSRLDNLKAHIWLHTRPVGGRVEYHADAQRVWEGMPRRALKGNSGLNTTVAGFSENASL